MDDLQTGVYAIRCLTNNRVYVGSAARSFRHRWSRHRTDLRRQKHCNKALQNAWNKYGDQGFQFEILLVCDPSECIVNEQRFIDELKAATKSFGFNLAATAGSTLGCRHSEETRRKLSVIRTGRQMSAASRAKSADTQRGRKRPPFSADWREKLGAATRGKKKSDAVRSRMSAAAKGKIRSAAHCAAISASKLGVSTGPLSEQARAKISASKVGKKRPLHVVEAMQRGRREAKAKRLKSLEEGASNG